MNLINDFSGKFVSNNTQLAYSKDLEEVYNLLNKDLTSLTSEDLVDYRNQLISSGMSFSTINRKFSTLRTFFKWAILRGFVKVNPADFVEIPKLEVIKPTAALMDEEVVKMLQAPNLSTLEGNIHRMVLVLLLNLGLRRSELIKLTFNDIYKDSGHFVIRILGKGGKYRRLAINTNVLTEIKTYKENFAKLSGRKLVASDYIIQSLKTPGKPVAPSTIYRIANRYANLIGVDRTIGAHSLRATVISHLLDTKKVPIRDVADFAGHKSTNTTQIYDKKRKGLTDSAAYKVGY